MPLSAGHAQWVLRLAAAAAVNAGARDGRLKVLIRTSFDGSKGRYGSPRIHADLRDQHERVSRKRIIRLMQEEQLVARARKRFVNTTMSDHGLPVATNLLERQFTATAPNQRWVGDTTECVVGESAKLYLAAILDLYSRFIVGWAVSAVNDRHLAIKALAQALQRRAPAIGLLHHSDQGCTYASGDYRAILEAREITCSMSRRGDCYDNAVVESFFGTLKQELVRDARWKTHAEARAAIHDYIEVFYNRQRLHSALGYRTPSEVDHDAA